MDKSSRSNREYKWNTKNIHSSKSLRVFVFFSFSEFSKFCLLAIRKLRVSSFKIWINSEHLVKLEFVSKYHKIDSRKDNETRGGGISVVKFLPRLCSLKWKQVSESSSLAAFASTVYMCLCVCVYTCTRTGCSYDARRRFKMQF